MTILRVQLGDYERITLGICFFFQAEDGIRDIGVTGVQTCALPICRADSMKPYEAMSPHSDSKREPKIDMTVTNSFAIDRKSVV